MKRMILASVVPAYLFLCIVLGGSAQGTWGKLALEILGVGLIAWAALRKPAESNVRPTFLYATLLVGLAVVAIQLIPLPASIWSALPGRDNLVSGFQLLGFPLPSLAISEAPFTSVMTLFAFIPAVAAFVATEKLRPPPRLLAIAVLAGTVLAVLFGAIQVADGPGSWAYFYKITNEGAVGFFANQNHMATLLLVTIPLTMALIHSAAGEKEAAKAGRRWMGFIVLVLVLVGVALNGSLAAYALVVPVVLASLASGQGLVRWRRFAIPIAVLAFAGGVLLLIGSPLSNAADDSDASRSVTSRLEIWKGTARVIGQNFPVGSGLGTFEQAYPQQEDPLAVGREYVNHAHDDYLELVTELGFAGALLILAFLAWWGATSIAIWRSRMSTPFAKAATVVTAAVLLHSIVDFPLRTSAIAAIFAAALALMAQPALVARDRREARPSRHVKLG